MTTSEVVENRNVFSQAWWPKVHSEGINGAKLSLKALDPSFSFWWLLTILVLPQLTHTKA